MTKQQTEGPATRRSLALEPRELVEYRSHKRVHAAPMTRGEYARYVSSSISALFNGRPGDEGFPDDEGYLVVYNRDTPDHYESWSPKRVFDDGYTCLEPGHG